MPFINRLPVDSVTDGRAVIATTTPVSGDPYVAGNRYSDATALGVLYVITGAVPAGVPFQDGVARTDLGQVYVLIDNPPATNARYYNDGILCDGLGHMCLTAINAIANYVHGWPVDAIGQVCVTGGTPPPPAVTISDIVITGIGTGEGNYEVFAAQLYFGTTGAAADTYYTVKATFLSENPGLTLQPFTGIAPPSGTAPQSVFSGFVYTVFSTGSGTPFGVPTVWDSLAVIDQTTPFLPSIYCAVKSNHNFDNGITFTFSPAVSATGVSMGSRFTGQTYSIEFFNGATLLHTEYINPSHLVSDFDQFRGYATSGTPADNIRTTSGGDTRTTSGGDTRVIA